MRRLSLLIAATMLISLFAAIPANAGDKPTSTPKAGVPAGALVPNQSFHLTTSPSLTKSPSGPTPLSNFGGAGGTIECWGFSYGGSGNLSVWGQGFQTCSGVGIILQQMEVDVIWCVSTPFGLCWPAENQGAVATNEIYGAGGFWAPSSGSSSRSVQGGRSYMIQSTHKAFWSGGLLQGTSTSTIFYVSG